MARTCENCDHKLICSTACMGSLELEDKSCEHWSGWIPITSSSITDEERKENGWDEDITRIFTCQFPVAERWRMSLLLSALIVAQKWMRWRNDSK